MAILPRRPDEDFSDEVEAHLELETDRLIAEGMAPEAARAAARRAFGNVAIAKERFHESSRIVWLEQLGQDLRYAWRGMRQSPAFVATTVLTLAVGLGLLTIAFTVFNAYVLRPFAIRDPASLHQIGWRAPDGGGQGFRWRDYEELRQRTDLFAAVIGERTRVVDSNGRPLMAAIVSLNYFDALGPAIALGRGLSSIDAGGAGDAAVLSDQAWTRLYERDASIVGRAIDLNGRRFTIVGVLGPAFTGLGDTPRDVFVPFAPAWDPPRAAAGDRLRETEITARLQSGVTAAAAADALTPSMAQATGRQGVRADVRPQPSPNALSTEIITIVTPVFAAFLLVLVTACANVSNVMLARAIARSREIAIRLSIGASRGRVVRQLVTEGVLMAMLAGAAGLAVAAWGLRLTMTAFLGTLPASVAPLIRLAPLTYDYRVFFFAFTMSAAATVVFALLPALQASRVSLVGALGGRHGSRRASRLRSALVVAQVAVAIVLVIVAVTLARNAAALAAADVGFDTAGVLSVNIRGEQDGLTQPLAEALAADPRVQSIAVTSGNPLFNQGTIVAAAPEAGGAVTPTPCTFVSPEFFDILRLPIARGRAFRPEEARAAAPVAIVSAATAQALWPGQDPIGRTISIETAAGGVTEPLPGYSSLTVVGTVRDISSGIMVTGRDRGHIYLPVSPADRHAVAMLARSRTGRETDAAAVQELIRRSFPDPEAFEVLPLSEMRSLQTYPVLAAAWVGGVLGAIALVLSVSGLYGVLTYTLSQRTKEIGIRMALGATAGAVRAMVLRQSTRFAGIGAAIGVTAAFVALQLLNSAIHLEAVRLVDGAAFAAGIALVIAATLAAAYRPAARATRIDPSETLRTDT